MKENYKYGDKVYFTIINSLNERVETIGTVMSESSFFGKLWVRTSEPIKNDFCVDYSEIKPYIEDKYEREI